MSRTVCLNALLAATLLFSGCASLSARQEAADTPPKPSVAQIQSSITQDPSMTVSRRRGWTMAKDSKGFVLWTFTPEQHPAYPSAIRREVVNRDGAARIEMSVFCESTRVACDALVEQSKDKNRRIKKQLQDRYRMRNI